MKIRPSLSRGSISSHLPEKMRASLDHWIWVKADLEMSTRFPPILSFKNDDWLNEDGLLDELFVGSTYGSMFGKACRPETAILSANSIRRDLRLFKCSLAIP